MQFKQEQMEFVNQLLYPILILKKNRDEERPSTQLEQQLEDIVEEMRHMRTRFCISIKMMFYVCSSSM